jgi:hypothetical protein
VRFTARPCAPGGGASRLAPPGGINFRLWVTARPRKGGRRAVGRWRRRVEPSRWSSSWPTPYGEPASRAGLGRSAASEGEGGDDIGHHAQGRRAAAGGAATVDHRVIEKTLLELPCTVICPPYTSCASAATPRGRVHLLSSLGTFVIGYVS